MIDQKKYKQIGGHKVIVIVVRLCVSMNWHYRAVSLPALHPSLSLSLSLLLVSCSVAWKRKPKTAPTHKTFVIIIIKLWEYTEHKKHLDRHCLAFHQKGILQIKYRWNFSYPVCGFVAWFFCILFFYFYFHIFYVPQLQCFDPNFLVMFMFAFWCFCVNSFTRHTNKTYRSIPVEHSNTR